MVLSEKLYSITSLLKSGRSSVKKKFRAGEINGWERLQKLNTYTVITVVVKGSTGTFKCYEQLRSGNALVWFRKLREKKHILNLQIPHGLAWQPPQNKSFCFKPYPAKNFMLVLSTVCAVIDSTQSMVWTCCTDYAAFAGLRPKPGFWCTNIPHWLISSEML